MKATNTTAPLAISAEMESMNFVPRRVDLRVERRARFIKGVQRQINRLKKFQIEPSSRDWFELLDGGSVYGPKCIASLHNGSKAMPLTSEGMTHISFDTTFEATTSTMRLSTHAETGSWTNCSLLPRAKPGKHDRWGRGFGAPSMNGPASRWAVFISPSEQLPDD